MGSRPREAAPARPAPEPSACLAELGTAGGIALPVGQPGSAEGPCRIKEPVRLRAVALPGARSVALPDQPVVACRLAVAFSRWVVEVAAPALDRPDGARLKAVQTGPGWECRGRNRQAGAKISAHGRGLAVDVASLTFTDGRALPVATAAASSAGFQSARLAACARFTTVLGPGSDPSHADHLHLDIETHGRDGRYRICQ